MELSLLQSCCNALHNILSFFSCCDIVHSTAVMICGLGVHYAAVKTIYIALYIYIYAEIFVKQRSSTHPQRSFSAGSHLVEACQQSTIPRV